MPYGQICLAAILWNNKGACLLIVAYLVLVLNLAMLYIFHYQSVNIAGDFPLAEKPALLFGQRYIELKDSTSVMN